MSKEAILLLIQSNFYKELTFCLKIIIYIFSYHLLMTLLPIFSHITSDCLNIMICLWGQSVKALDIKKMSFQLIIKNCRNNREYNSEKFTQIIFTLKRRICPKVAINIKHFYLYDLKSTIICLITGNKQNMQTKQTHQSYTITNKMARHIKTRGNLIFI